MNLPTETQCECGTPSPSLHDVACPADLGLGMRERFEALVAERDALAEKAKQAADALDALVDAVTEAMPYSCNVCGDFATHRARYAPRHYCDIHTLPEHQSSPVPWRALDAAVTAACAALKAVR